MDKIKTLEDFSKYYIWVDTQEECEEIYQILKSKFENICKAVNMGTCFIADCNSLMIHNGRLNNCDNRYSDKKTPITIEQLKEMLKENEFKWTSKCSNCDSILGSGECDRFFRPHFMVCNCGCTEVSIELN